MHNLKNKKMMANQLIALLLLFFPITKIGTDSLSQINPINLVQNGISISDFKKQIKTGEFVSESLSNYGIDSENLGWTLINNGQKILFIWSKQNSELIDEIIILNSSLSMDNITVGTTLDEFLKNNPNAKIEIDVINSEYEYAYSEEKNYTVEFLLPENKIAEFNEDYTLKRIVNRKAKIDRIRVKRCE